ncbi:PEP/pyruvate-binding domain-containing protein [Trichlorobacter ammonificans]|uniref:Phosphoenolpyruvate synthase n=1 Tax=Trichlorobacter ammonificans TaxID=2916410 RepID=A0ABM9D5E3_9BACT|nr:PEP/pyruvate-binding domain-containing protein [Trichlorobacter ammonificans]CAH2030395.1 Phosphoenolpyruvate synthase [Trichlorobacter ammonificans]
MQTDQQPPELIQTLLERERELNCLYRIEELLARRSCTLEGLLHDVIAAVPSGWRFPERCQARIVYDGVVYAPPHFKPTPWSESAPIPAGEREAGSLEVSYTTEVLPSPEGIFLEKESKLLRTIADRIGQTLLQRTLEKQLGEQQAAPPEWPALVDALRRTDERLYIYCSRKMLYLLCRSDITEARQFLDSFAVTFAAHHPETASEVNYPSRQQPRNDILEMSEQVFALAARHLTDAEILSSLHRWIQENRLSFLIKTIDSPTVSLDKIIDVILRYRAQIGDGTVLEQSTEKWLRVSLIRRFFSDSIDFINFAKHHLRVSDFFDLVTRIIYPAESNGRLGGKSTGLFVAWRILARAAEKEELLADIRIPKTWYLTADCLTSFLHHNDLEDVSELKYKDIEQIRFEYPNIIQLFKHARFPADVYRGLSHALDDFGERPIIVRSSSLLEDRAGTAFSGKYKSLFLHNQGDKRTRLHALLDAIAEIYASVFGPDPIAYRAERGLLDFREEMGILIQEVVGRRVGPYHLPLFAGVALSSNEFRWSPRLRRDDGLCRLVPGLGTRAVDRISNDYPLLLSPGQPGLRVNVTPNEIRRYSPTRVDLINLQERVFETVALEQLLQEHGRDIPHLSKLVSAYRDGQICHLPTFELQLNDDELVATFEGLVKRTPFVRQIRAIMQTLREAMGMPVEIEFANDGDHLYLLQCRPQCLESDTAPGDLRHDIPECDLLFTAHRFISNGRVPEITHIVYVPPEQYAAQSSLETMLDIGRAVGLLNTRLPRRRFILMGPGRWGSRGDIKQGVHVSYADICNTAVLIEIAYRAGAHEPDLSFGTHFFQDMVEAGIRYIPLYPEDHGNLFNRQFLTESPNRLTALAPEYAHLSDVLRVIDVPRERCGNILKIVMDADQVMAAGYFIKPSDNG